jgi:hypothetical protein
MYTTLTGMDSEGLPEKYTRTVESRLSDLRLPNIPFYPTCRVGTLHFINSHSEGLNSIKTELAYAEQQREATATDIYCSGAGMTLPQRKGRRLRSKYPFLIS